METLQPGDPALTQRPWEKTVADAPDAAHALAGGAEASQWRATVSHYLSTPQVQAAWASRVESLSLTPRDIEVFCETLKESAVEGKSIGDFLFAWSTLQSELPGLANKYPPIKRTIRLARLARQEFYTRQMEARLHSNPTALLKYVENKEFMGDPLLEQDNEEEGKDVEKMAERLLINAGVEPCEYKQVLLLQGELPSLDYHPDHHDYKLIGLSPSEVIEIFKGANPAKSGGESSELADIWP